MLNEGATLRLSGAVLTNNVAVGSDGRGGGVYAADGTTLSLLGAMLHGNQAERDKNCAAPRAQVSRWLTQVSGGGRRAVLVLWLLKRAAMQQP